MQRILLFLFCFSFFPLNAQDNFDEDCNVYVFNTTPLTFEIQIQESLGIWTTLKDLTIGSFSNNDFSKILKSSDFQYGKFRFFEIKEGTYVDLTAPGCWFITRPLDVFFDYKCAPLEIQGPNCRSFFGAVVRNSSKSRLYLFRNKYTQEKENGKDVKALAHSFVKSNKTCGIGWSSICAYKHIAFRNKNLLAKKSQRYILLANFIPRDDMTVFNCGQKVAFAKTSAVQVMIKKYEKDEKFFDVEKRKKELELFPVKPIGPNKQYSVKCNQLGKVMQQYHLFENLK